jgi:ribosomal subunit interface protein
MDIIVKGRHTDVGERFRRHVGTKVAKIAKLDPKVIRVDVEVSEEHNPRQSDTRERIEMTIVSRGPVIRAEASADDRYGALDVALAKLESRLRRMCDRRKAHHAGHAGMRMEAALTGAEGEGDTLTAVEEVPAEAAPSWDEEPRAAHDADEHIVPIDMEGDGPVVLREKDHRADPMTLDQALFEMELVGHDFYLFRDKESGRPSVVYRRRGWDYGVIRLVEE